MRALSILQGPPNLGQHYPGTRTRPLHLSAVVMIHASFIHVYLYAVYKNHFPAMHRARTSRMHALTSAQVDGLSPSGSLRLSRVASRTKAASRCTFLSPSP